MSQNGSGSGWGHERGRTRRTFVLGGGVLAGAIAAHRLLAVPPRSPGGEGADGIVSDYRVLQAALDRRGVVRLNRTYTIGWPLTVRGGTQILGDRRARIIWRGPPDQPILRDSSRVDPGEVNRDIVLQDFTVDGGGSRDPRQIGIDFYRTGNVRIRDLTVHGVGGSGIRWGHSMADTTDILVERCRVFGCHAGDAIQGCGRRITVRDNLIGKNGSESFGDTGIALLTDFEPQTNPAGRHSTDVAITGNTIVGAADSGTHTGIALGPFATDHDASVTIATNRISNCYVNVWIAVMRGVTLTGNDFGAHCAALTAGIRFDGVSDLRIERNRIGLRTPASARGRDHAAVMLNAQRNVFGASTFDADVVDFTIADNEIAGDGAAEGEGIRLAFGQDNQNPRYVSHMARGTITGNRFIEIDRPVVFASQYGENADVCRDVAVRGNLIDGGASVVAFMAGKPTQYQRVTIDRNTAPPHLPLRMGTGAM